MKRCLAVALVAALVCMAAAAAEAERERPPPPLDRGLTEQERQAVRARMQERQSRDDICVPPTSPPVNPIPLPVPPRSFTTNIEVTFMEEKDMNVIYGAESFDGVVNRGALRYELFEGVLLTRPYLLQEYIYYSIVRDEALLVTADTACEDTGNGNCDPRKICFAGKLEDMSAALQELFGFGDANGQGGYYGAGGILHWGSEFMYKYTGTTDCRGMVCHAFEACVKDPLENSTVLMTYYWSADSWTVSSNGESVPVAVEVLGNGKYGHVFSRAVHQRFDFFQFYSEVRPSTDELQPAADVYCLGRQSLYLPPRVPDFFAYNSEAVVGFDIPFPTGDNETQRVQFTAVFSNEEYYDWSAKVVKVDSIPWYITGQEYRYEYQTRRIQDFIQGLEYTLLTQKDQCFMRRIENLTTGGDVIVDGDGQVNLMPPWVFEDLDDPMQYNGEHWARDVSCDVWIGREKVLNTILHDSYVWYYASPLTGTETLDKVAPTTTPPSPAAKKDPSPPEVRTMDDVPIKLERYLDLLASYPHLIYNIYNYLHEPPLTHTLDISSCFTDGEMRHFVVDLPPDSLEKVYNMRDNLLHGAQGALAEAGVIAPLRINRIVLEERDDCIRLLFTILDTPDVEGDAPSTALLNDMDTAAELIRIAVDKSQLIIIVHISEMAPGGVEPTYRALVAVPHSMKEVTRNEGNDYTYTQSRGYTSGAMAGLAFGMLFVGMLIGVGVNMVINKRSLLPPLTSLTRGSNTNTSIKLNTDLTGSEI